MKKDLLISVGTITAGFLLNAFAWTTTFGHPVSTICLVAGLILCVTGFISFILIMKRRGEKPK